jgi:hypothetical protein
MFTIEGLGLKWDEESQIWKDSTGKALRVQFRDAGVLPAMDLEDEVVDMHSGSKYLRKIELLDGNKVDVYAVLEAFEVTCPARQHAIKKLLCSGIRGKGSVVQDLREARDAVSRAIEMQELRVAERQGVFNEIFQVDDNDGA